MENNAIDSKTKANAVSSYLLLFVSLFFLFNKENPYLNNNFVKTHVKTAFTIHLGFLITYVILVGNDLFSSLFIYGFSINELLTKAIFLLLLGGIVTGIYKANTGKYFKALDLFTFANNGPKKIIDINGDGKFGEKDKLTLLISYIPLISFLNYSKYQKNNIIRNNTKLSLIITLSIFLLYIFGHYNLAHLMSLFYTVFVVFAGINMFSRDQIISLNFNKIPTIKELSYIVKSLYQYTKNYFGDTKFIPLKEIVNKKIENDLKNEKTEEEELKKRKDCKIPSALIYIPYINLIFLFFRKTKYQFHIRNGITITALLILSHIIGYFGYYNTSFNHLIAIPILFGIGYSKTDSIYKMAFIYDIYELISKIASIFSKKTKEVNTLRKKETEVHLKVKQ